MVEECCDRPRKNAPPHRDRHRQDSIRTNPSSVPFSTRGSPGSRLRPEVSESHWNVDPDLHSGYTDGIEGETGRTSREGLP
jgi:hypothetical protein